jgi:hypothetical protein
MFEWIKSGFGPAIRIALLLASVFQPIALPAESVAVRYHEGVSHGFLVLRTPDGKPPEIMLIGANDRTRNPFGIYVVFPRNVGTIRARLHHDGWTSNLPIVLSRSRSSVIDISSKLERKPQ